MSSDRPASLDSLDRDINALARKVQNIEQTLRGEPDWGREGLMHQVRELTQAQQESATLLSTLRDQMQRDKAAAAVKAAAAEKNRDRFQNAALTLMGTTLAGIFITMLTTFLGGG